MGTGPWGPRQSNLNGGSWWSLERKARPSIKRLVRYNKTLPNKHWHGGRQIPICEADTTMTIEIGATGMLACVRRMVGGDKLDDVTVAQSRCPVRFQTRDHSRIMCVGVQCLVMSMGPAAHADDQSEHERSQTAYGSANMAMSPCTAHQIIDPSFASLWRATHLEVKPDAAERW